MEDRSAHEPVLLREAVDALDVQRDRHYVDCTFGRGGHTAVILERGGQVLALDADPQAVAAVALAATVVHAYFDELEPSVQRHRFAPVHGVLFDLGLSSPQLEDPDRGFSFMRDGPLDMRFDPTQGEPAERLVNEASPDELTAIFRDFGEEAQARKMARAVVDARPVLGTRHLATIIERAAGGRGRIHPATRIFQALRIAVNRELERLESALQQAVHVLEPGGRLVVITFHSLEDRVVKNCIAQETRDCICPPRTLVCVCGHKATLKPVTRKPALPGQDELRRNPRSRSAKLRVAERI